MLILSWLTGMMICFLKGPLVVMLILGHIFLLVSCVILCISMIFFVGNLEKASFIFNMSSVLSLVACVKDLMFLWYLDFAKTLALGLSGIGGGILDMLAGLVLFLFSMVSMFFIINCETIHWWKVLELLSAMSLFYPELYIEDTRSHVTKPNSEIWNMSWLFLLLRSLCLIKVAILWREQTMFLASLARNSFVPNRKIELKFSSHSCGSAGWFT